MEDVPMNSLVTLTALSMTPGVVNRDDRLPTGPAPLYRLARLHPEGKRVQIEQQFMRVITVTIPRSGKSIQKMVPYTQTTSYDLARVTVYDTTGRKIDPLELSGLLKYYVTVLVSSDGKGVDPLSVRRLRRKMVILVLPKD
jgi:hypothetical protein